MTNEHHGRTIKRRSFLVAGSSALATSLVKPNIATASYESGVKFPGINLSAAAFAASSKKPMNVGYTYPGDKYFRYYARAGFKLVRLPVTLERVQPETGGSLDPANIAEIERCVVAARDNGLLLIIDAHNYGQRDKMNVTGRDLTNFWIKIAVRFAHHSHVGYGLMNEPKAFEPPQWREIIETVVSGIRATGTKQLLMVPGSGWDGANTWVKNGNAASFETFHDPNFMFEVHQYLDSDSSGTNLFEYEPGAGVGRLSEITRWARNLKVRLFLGEFGFALPQGEVEARSLLSYINRNSDVWHAYAYFSGGPWWPAHYAFSAEPRQDGRSLQVEMMQEYFAQ